MRYDAVGAVSRSAASRYGVFTRKQAASLGLDHRAIAKLVASSTVHECRPGVLAFAAVSQSWEQDLAAAQAAGGGHGTVSLRSAARLFRLDGFAEDPALDLCSTRRLRVPGASTHFVRELLAADIVEIGPFRATGLARTLCDLGSVVSNDRLERALDSARRMDVNLRWVRETAEMLGADSSPARISPSRRCSSRSKATAASSTSAGQRNGGTRIAITASPSSGATSCTSATSPPADPPARSNSWWRLWMRDGRCSTVEVGPETTGSAVWGPTSAGRVRPWRRPSWHRRRGSSRAAPSWRRHRPSPEAPAHRPPRAPRAAPRE